MSKANEVVTNNATTELTDNSVFNVPFMVKTDADSKEVTHANELMLGLYNVHNGMQKAYADMCGYVAQLNACKAWTNYYNCANINQLVLAVLGCSPSTASELVKVAKRFYNSNGTLSSRMERYNYSMMLQLTKLSDDELEPTIELLSTVENLTRDHVRQLVEYVKSGKDIAKLSVDSETGRFLIGKTEDSDNSESATETADNSESTSESADNSESSDESADNSESKANSSVETEEKRKKSIDLFNEVVELRKKIDSMSKSDIKKAIDKLITDLGELSK